MINLKPCPFCGSKGNNIVVITDQRTDRTDCNFTSRVSCLNCFGGIHTHGFYWTAEEAQENAIQKWNKRNENRECNHWIELGEETGVLGIVYTIKKCPVCGFEHSLVIPSNYCPQCGTKME